MLIKVMMLMLVLCFASVASAEKSLDQSSGWTTQAELVVSGEEIVCNDLVFDAIPDALLIAQGGCCRMCSKGKACGNSCISRSNTCHQPRGCACDG